LGIKSLILVSFRLSTVGNKEGVNYKKIHLFLIGSKYLLHNIFHVIWQLKSVFCTGFCTVSMKCGDVMWKDLTKNVNEKFSLLKIFFKQNQLSAHYFLLYLFLLLYMFRVTMFPSFILLNPVYHTIYVRPDVTSRTDEIYV